MEYVKLGNSGLKVSRLCLGMMSYGDPQWRDWTMGEEEAEPIVKQAWELGINFFDTANMYSLGVSEVVTGKILKKFAKREEVVIASKVHFPMGKGPNERGLSRKHINASVNDSLRRLDTDYIDLYYIHRWDYETPIEETMETLHQLVVSGKVRYIGASSMFAWQFAKAQYLADIHNWTRFIAMQNHYNIIYREEEREMNPLCIEENVGIVPWSPLARGFLLGDRFKGEDCETPRGKTDTYGQGLYNHPSDPVVVKVLNEMANEKEVSPIQLGLAWMMHKPGITSPIVGSTKVKHMEQLVEALDIKLTTAEMERLEKEYQPHAIAGHS
ncbi:MAG: aldo/keto reductase [Calditrichaeota bacterium]|nr:aldo/keto reductase [Calditrichota bacterium]